VSETVVTDGRASRSARTRAAVVEALLALIEGGNLRPTARQIADEAGVSLRSVYVHFDDVESLFIAAAGRHHERLEALRTPCQTTGPLGERITSLTERRRTMYEEGAQVRRAAVLQEPFSPALSRVFDLGRAAMRAEVEIVFAAELDELPEDERPQLAAALEVAISSGTWDSLRTRHDLPPDEAAALVQNMLRAVLAGWPRGEATNHTTSDAAENTGTTGDTRGSAAAPGDPPEPPEPPHTSPPGTSG
jgi:TetR/AcrR family transcriptional regulator, regulator of autoinduction and epiphytic fitness